MTRSDENSERECPFFLWLAAYVVLLSAIQIAVLGTSLASLRLSRTGAVGILFAALLVTWMCRRGLMAGVAASSTRTAAADQRRGWPWLVAFAAFYLFLFACAAIVPDVSWDGNTYHLPTIQQWFQQGRVVWVEGPDDSHVQFMNGYPKAAELLSFFLCILVHPALVNTLDLVYLPLGILGIASIAHELGASRRAALYAGAAFLLVPINLGQSLTTYVDSAFGAAAIAWLAVTVRLRVLDPKRLWLQALILGCALGQMIGVKATGLLLGAVGSIMLCGLHLKRRPSGLPMRRLVTWWLGALACVLLVGGFWYARNLVYRQNPLYPIRLSVLGFTLRPGLDAYRFPGAFATDGWLAEWPTVAQVAITWSQGVWHWPKSIIGFDSRVGGLGFLWPLGCLPAIFALVRQRIRLRAAWRDELLTQPLWLLLAIASIGMVIQPYPWWSRFTIWVYGLGLPCLAAAQRMWIGRWGRAWLATCAAIALLEAGIVVARLQLPLVSVALSDQQDGQKRPRTRIPTHFYPPWQLHGTILERLARGHDSVGIVTLPWYAAAVVGVLSQPVGARQVSFVPDDLEADFASWYARVQPRYILMAKQEEIPEPMFRLAPQVHQGMRSLTVLQFW